MYIAISHDEIVKSHCGLNLFGGCAKNPFHDPAETDPDILKLRNLHSEMDRAVLDAYGWSDVPTTCGFGLDYLDLDDDITLPADLQERIDSGDLFFASADEANAFNAAVRDAQSGRRRLPWRYRWPDEVRDDVLARLLALNQKRYEAEVLEGKQGPQDKGQKAKGKRQKAKSESATPTIPGMEV